MTGRSSEVPEAATHSLPFVGFSEGQSSAALHVAAVLFTSLWKPITWPRCWASRGSYSPAHRHTWACTRQDASRAHPPTHTDKHLQRQLFLAAVERQESELSVVKYINMRTQTDYLQLGRITRQLSKCMKNDGLFTKGFYIGWNARWL